MGQKTGEGMQIVSRYFEDLTVRELYEILRLRSEVFVVEQQCIYQDMDGKDPESLHVFLMQDGRLEACLRAYVREEGVVQMGRVVTRHHGRGYGGVLLRAGLEKVREEMHPRQIVLEAQSYAVGFYEREGFRTCSEEFLEDGIPHVQMKLEL